MKRFLRTFGEAFSEFRYADYQDVHEFLSCLLLSLDEDVNVASKFSYPMDGRVINQDQSKKDKVAYFRQVKQQLEDRDRSVITEMFGGIVGDCITCKNCRKPKYKYETELMLSLPLDVKAPGSVRDNISAAAGSSFLRSNVTI